MKIQKICILGGTGFVGGHLVAHLANRGYQMKVLTRHRERHREFIVLPNVDLIEADVRDAKALQEQFSGCDAVINLIAILNGSEQAFRAIHVELPQRIVAVCRQVGIKRLLHMSALNADAAHGPSLYLRTKGEGEQAAHRASEYGIPVTSFRPSIIFGPDDHFFNRFAGLLKFTPVLPLACPNARFSPVYVIDVVHALEAALTNESTFGKGLDLCGPRTYTLKELVEYTAQLIGRRRLVLGLSDRLARLQARVFERLPGQLFTMDNYQSLQVDNVCRTNDFATLDMTPMSVEAIMPQYLAGKRQRARYNTLRKIGRR